jgi:PST family polysaccharide transporter
MTYVQGNLARAGARGVLWQGLAFAVGKILVFVTVIVLARLLSPEEYGLVALALVLIAYVETIADAGVAQALVYLPRTGEIVRSALLISLLLGGLLSSGAILAAPLIAGVFGLTEMAPLVAVLAVSLLATSFAAVPEALMRRDLHFKRLAAAPVVRAAVTATVTLILAFDGLGAGSLAIGTAAGSVSYAAACWLLLPGRAPWQIWRVRKDALLDNLRYGAPVAGSTLLARLIFDVDYLIIGAVMGAQALGYYTLAFRLPEMVIISVFFVLSSVMFPLYTQVRDEPELLRAGYLKSVQLQSLYGVTAGVGLAVTAPVLVPVLFGEQWHEVVLPLVFLSLYAAARSLGAGANDVYKALGRPGLSVGISLVRLVILVPALLYASQWGIVGVASTQLIVALLFACGMQMLAAKVTQLGVRQLLRAVVPGLVCGVVVAVAGLGTFALPLLGGPTTIIVIVITAVAAVNLILRLWFRPLHEELLRLMWRSTRSNVTQPQAAQPGGTHQIPATLVVVAPRVGSGGVGDYAEELIAEAAPLFANFREVRTGGPGQAGLRDLIRDRLRLSQVVRESEGQGPVVIHFELSAGSLSPFWLLAGRKGWPTTATVHDPPLSVWWPFRSRVVAKSYLMHHGIHFPLRRLSAMLERWVLKDTVLFALSDTGSQALRRKFPSCEVLSARHFVPPRAPLRRSFDRPLAVGLFGHAYKGKGFDRLLDLRRALPNEVEIRVAGRGTENLSAIPGVTILGGVEGAEEDAFFDSVRAILLPYDKTSRYYGNILSASGVATRAFGYGTPVIALESATLTEAAHEGGLLTAPNSIDSLAAIAFKTITSENELQELENQIVRLQITRAIGEAVMPFVEEWKRISQVDSRH